MLQNGCQMLKQMTAANEEIYRFSIRDYHPYVRSGGTIHTTTTSYIRACFSHVVWIPPRSKPYQRLFEVTKSDKAVRHQEEYEDKEMDVEVQVASIALAEPKVTSHDVISCEVPKSGRPSYLGGGPETSPGTGRSHVLAPYLRHSSVRTFVAVLHSETDNQDIAESIQNRRTTSKTNN